MKKKMMMLVMGTCLVLSGCSSSAGKSEPVNAQIEKTTESSGNAENNTEGGDSSKEIVAGVCWYNFADTFISNTRQTLLNVSEADQTIKVMDADSQNDTSNQTNNMINFLTKDVDYLVLNNINTGAISEICDQLKEAGCYAIFANTDSPKDEDFKKNDKLYLVSSNAPKSGSIMGEALVEYWKTHPEADRNGNGKMDYVMLLGIQSHYDTIVRSQYSVDAIKAAGIGLNNIGGEIVCDYSRATAQEKVSALLANYRDDIDAIIACNDDMALGAIEALKAGGFFEGEGQYIPVTGVDATVVGCEAVKDGTLLVTALNNPVNLAKAIYKVMFLTSKGEEVTTESMGMESVTVEGHRVWLDYKTIAKDNVEDANYDITNVKFK